MVWLLRVDMAWRKCCGSVRRGVVVVVVVVAQGITGVYIERGLKAFNEGQSTHHMGGATGSFWCQIPHHDVLWPTLPTS